MSSHADTIREALDNRWDDGDFTLAYASLDALLTENQRLRDALLNIASYGDQESIIPAESDKMVRFAREALAGDAE